MYFCIYHDFSALEGCCSFHSVFTSDPALPINPVRSDLINFPFSYLLLCFENARLDLSPAQQCFLNAILRRDQTSLTGGVRGARLQRRHDKWKRFISLTLLCDGREKCSETLTHTFYKYIFTSILTAVDVNYKKIFIMVLKITFYFHPDFRATNEDGVI